MIPRLRKQPEKKSCHGQKWIDEYSWIHQDNCLEILRDPRKLNPEVREYLEEENSYTKEKMKDTENIQKKIDNWHISNKGKEFDKIKYIAFLKSIGFIIESSK